MFTEDYTIHARDVARDLHLFEERIDSRLIKPDSALMAVLESKLQQYFKLRFNLQVRKEENLDELVHTYCGVIDLWPLRNMNAADFIQLQNYICDYNRSGTSAKNIKNKFMFMDFIRSDLIKHFPSLKADIESLEIRTVDVL